MKILSKADRFTAQALSWKGRSVWVPVPVGRCATRCRCRGEIARNALKAFVQKNSAKVYLIDEHPPFKGGPPFPPIHPPLKKGGPPFPKILNQNICTETLLINLKIPKYYFSIKPNDKKYRKNLFFILGTSLTIVH